MRRLSGHPPIESSAIESPEFAHLLDGLRPCAPLAVAVSGGADSMALALLAHAWATASGHSLTALTVDHGLRAESTAEALQVRAWMQARGIAHTILPWTHHEQRGNVPQAARNARYRLLSGWCRAHGVRDLALAHHRDDQAETLLLRLKRGSHIDGLSGMARVTELHGIRLLRPLLTIAKARLVATLRAQNQPWLEDASNADQRYDRNRLRAMLNDLPEYDTLAEALIRSAAALRKLREHRAAERNAFLAAHAGFQTPSTAHITFTALISADDELALSALSILLQRIGGRPHPPRFTDLQRLYDALRGGVRARTLHGCIIARRDAFLHIAPEIRGKALEAAQPASYIS